VVSEETTSVAKEINKLREEKGFCSLKIIKAPNIYNSDNELVSSTMIRSKLCGQINHKKG
jgi:phosphopantetheine adenylyltransferase